MIPKGNGSGKVGSLPLLDDQVRGGSGFGFDELRFLTQVSAAIVTARSEFATRERHWAAMFKLQCPPLPAPTLRQNWILSGKMSDEGDVGIFSLTPLPFRVGRRPEMSLTLPRSTVSGAHAEFFERNRVLHIRDLGSTNGTFVNGERLSEVREVRENDLIQFADAPFRVNVSKAASPSHTRCENACDQAMAFVQFDRLISGSAVVPHFQPIIDLQTRRTIAYESLARSRLLGLETPNLMFSAGAQLGLNTELSQVLRKVAVQDSGLFPAPAHLFLNTHPCEMDVRKLIDSCEDLRRSAPHQRLTIEIHEAALTNVEAMMELRHGLEKLNISLAFDDFGAGQARIAELAEIRPQYLKFDRCMIRDLNSADSSRRHVVDSLVLMARNVGIIPLAEGVETVEECEACEAAGFLLAQGFLFGRPMPVTHYIVNS